MKLSDRDKKIVQLLCEELTYKEIANEFQISESELRSWMRRLRKGIGAKNSIGVVYKCLKTGAIA